MSRFPRRILTATILVAAAAALTSCSGPATSTPADSPSMSEPTPGPDEALVYVGLGDSWPNGDHCGHCETFIGRYADGLEGLLDRSVTLIDRTTAGGGAESLRDDVTTDAELQASLADADVVVISTGPNDLDYTGALMAVGDGTCGDGNACLNDLYEDWRTNFAAILDQIAELRAGAPTVIRLVPAQNIFVSDPSIAPDYGLPDDFALTTGAEITATLTTIMCDAAESHGGECVDVALMFNGPDGTIPRDENSVESHQEVADALIALGVDELPAAP